MHCLDQEMDDRVSGKRQRKCQGMRLRTPPNLPRGFLAETTIQPLPRSSACTGRLAGWAKWVSSMKLVYGGDI